MFGELVQRSWYSESLKTGEWVFKSWQGQEIFSYPKLSRPALGLTQAPIQWVPWFFPGDKVLGHDIVHSPPSSAKVKTGWSYSSTPPMYLYSMDRDNLILPFTVVCVHSGFHCVV
jgi:hypothetical protein